MNNPLETQQIQFDFDNALAASSEKEPEYKVSLAFLEHLEEEKNRHSQAAIIEQASVMVRHLQGI